MQGIARHRARPGTRHILGRSGRGHYGFRRDAEDFLHVCRPAARPGRRMSLAGHYSYWVTIFLMIAGLYIVIARGNLVKKMIGLGIFQTSVYLLYIAPR